ncbi:MAG: hypothetical protein ACJAZO_002337 [Myxococcota bacterium]
MDINAWVSRQYIRNGPRTAEGNLFVVDHFNRYR